jgi:hypothetical protein
LKDQYFGDVNDYRKYGLLRALLAGSGLSLLVAWMLTRDDGGRDGGCRSFMKKPERWRHHDPELYDGLSVFQDSSPEVSLIQCSGLLPHASFHSEPVPDGRLRRDSWQSGLLEAASSVDLVFLDPDNGVEVPSVPIGCRDSSKYLSWSEIEHLWGIGCSLLIYQHYPRRPRETFTATLASELGMRIGVERVTAIRTASVLFMLVGQPEHAESLERGVEEVRVRWLGELYPDEYTQTGWLNMNREGPG